MNNGALFGLCVLGALATGGIRQLIRYPAVKREAEKLIESIPDMTENDMALCLKLNRPIPPLPFDVCGRIRYDALNKVTKALAAKRAGKG